MNPYIYIETASHKFLRSLNTNYNFNKNTGFTQMWGRTLEEDILYSDVGPLILDMEISTICNGYKNVGKCPMCYKNGANPQTQDQNMSLDTFKKILDSLSIDCFKITFEDGSEIYVTENVQVLTKRGIVLVKDLIEDDNIIKVIVDD